MVKPEGPISETPPICIPIDRAGAPVLNGCGARLAQYPRQVAAGVGPRSPGDLFWRAGGNDGPATVAAPGPQVDDVVGGAHGRFVVLNDDDGIADVAEPLR